MKTIFIFWLSLAASFSAQANEATDPIEAVEAAQRAICQLQPAQVLEESRGHFLAKWDFPTAEILSNKSLPDSVRLKSYQNAAGAALDVNPYHLLERYSAKRVKPDDFYNLQIVAKKKAGVIHKITCIEALMEDFQLQRGSGTNEFFAFFLRRQGAARVYFYTNDAGSVSDLHSLIPFISLDVKNGWSVTGNLHNHAFFLDQLESDTPQGVLAPSATDAAAFQSEAKDLDLTAANITNGIHTVRIMKRDFSQFKGAQ